MNIALQPRAQLFIWVTMLLVTERISLAGLSVLGLLGLWLAPWVALSRQTGARSAVLLLPNRFLDFTGRTELIPIAGLNAVLLLSLIGFALVIAAAFLKNRARYALWLAAGILLIIVTSWGLGNVQSSVRGVRVERVVELIEEELADPRDRTDVAALEEVLLEVPNSKIDLSILKARKAGFTIRRLAYDGSGIGLGAFLAYLTGALSLFFGLRLLPALDRTVTRILTLVSVPAVSIVLSLLVAAGVILLLQETASNNDALTGWQPYLAGRLETLWYAYMTLFSKSLGTLGGFAESLKFTTPLIFTGLAVAFGFQAGLFNIGAPGQMILGAIGAMVVGLYMPGPRIVVIPLAILGAAIGGGLWGALPGWLKARFGANEVINTILLNYIASSLLLFILSDSLTFALPALWALYFLGYLALVLIILSLIPAARRGMAGAPRVVASITGIVALAGIVIAGSLAPRARPVTLRMPFKAPGSEPKSFPLQDSARLNQLRDFIRLDGVGDAIWTINLALVLGILALALAFMVLPNIRRFGLWTRLGISFGTGLAVFGLGSLFGLSSVDTIVPPTGLNTSFLIAIGAAIFMQYFMWRTKWGYELRAVGVAPEAAEYGGASIARNTILALTLSGAFAGLTACHYVLGGALEEYSLRQALPTNDGFDGIAVALLGGNTPVGVVLSAFLFGVLKNGGVNLNVTFSGLTRDVVSMIVALVVLFIAAKGFLPERYTDPIRRRLFLDKEEPEPTRSGVTEVSVDIDTEEKEKGS